MDVTRMGLLSRHARRAQGVVDRCLVTEGFDALIAQNAALLAVDAFCSGLWRAVYMCIAGCVVRRVEEGA